MHCRTNDPLAVVSDSVSRKVRPQRVAACRQKELLCAMAFQELKWHKMDDVEFDKNIEDVPELVVKSGTPVLDNRDPVWTSY